MNQIEHFFIDLFIGCGGLSLGMEQSDAIRDILREVFAETTKDDSK